MEFKTFKEKMQKHIENMLKGQTTLFTANIDKDVLWSHYLSSFPPGTNNLYRTRLEFDCGCCKQFIRAFGDVVAIKGTKIITVWDFNTDSPVFQPVVDALAAYVRSSGINGVFVTDTNKFGTDVSHETLVDKTVVTWNHFYAVIPPNFIDKSGKSIGTVIGDKKATKEVFMRSLEEISKDSIETVLDLIAQNSLYKGEEWEPVLQQFLTLHKEYSKLKPAVKDTYCWRVSTEKGGALTRIRNHSIGTLLTNISEGMDFETAVRKYESIVAPSNYKRPKAVFTKKMVEDAQKVITELGMVDSLSRRFAEIGDITVANTLFADRNSVKRMKGIGVFDTLLDASVKKSAKEFGKVEQVTVTDFMDNILPTLTSIEVMVEGKHEENFISLIAPKVLDCPTMFKWGNNFSWAYKGNLTDSMKENVKAAGGNVGGVLRFSIQWNDAHGENRNDFDAHCKEPKGDHIYFGNKRHVHPSSGVLDVDIIHPDSSQIAVENISYSDIRMMPVGDYKFLVNIYSHRGYNTGFSAEIEFNGEIYSFECRNHGRGEINIPIATVSLDKNGIFKIKDSIKSSVSSRDIWGVTTNQFYPVSILMLSPNYWDGKGVGNKHWFFMLDGCKNDANPSGFFNEFLTEELTPHRKVLEALSGQMRVEDSDRQLSGLGFSSTKRASLIVKVTGSFSRMLQIMF